MNNKYTSYCSSYVLKQPLSKVIEYAALEYTDLYFIMSPSAQ